MIGRNGANSLNILLTEDLLLEMAGDDSFSRGTAKISTLFSALPEISLQIIPKL